MKNPKRALDAFNAPTAVKVGPLEVREITLGLAGILEAIGSPLCTEKLPATVDGWAPTLYALTRPPEESRRLLAAGGRAGFERAATSWSDEELAVGVARRLIDAATAAVNRLNGISPDGDGEAGAEGNGMAAGPMAG